MKSKSERRKLVREERKKYGIKVRGINGKKISVSKEVDMLKGTTCYCANCREGLDNSSKGSMSERKNNNSHMPRMPFLNPTTNENPNHLVDFATGILKQQRRMTEFDMAIAVSRAALKVAQEMRKIHQANQKEQATKLAAEAKQQAEAETKQKEAEDQRKEEEATLRAAQKARRTASSRRREEIRKQSEEAARHKEAENKERAKENVQEEAASKEEKAKKKSSAQEGQKAKNQEGKSQEEKAAIRQNKLRQIAEKRKQLEQARQRVIVAHKQVEVAKKKLGESRKHLEEIRKKIEEEALNTAVNQIEEKLSQQVKEAEKQAHRRAKIRKGKQKLPQRDEEWPVAPPAKNNFSQSLDEALNQFVNTHSQPNPAEEAIQNYSQQTQKLLEKLQQEGLTSESEAQIHKVLLELHEKSHALVCEQKAAHQIKNLLTNQGATHIEISQVEAYLQQHEENLKTIQTLITQLEHGLQSAETEEMETTNQEAEKQAGEEANRKEAESVEIAKGASRWFEHKLYKQLEEEERHAQQKDEKSLTLQNAADEVAAYLEGIKEANFSPGAQKVRGKVLLKQVEALKKLEKHNYRITNQVMKDMDPIPAEMAQVQLLQHNSQLTAMRNLRSQLKKACPLTPEELAACKIKVKKLADKDGYESDTSDEDDDCSRADLAFKKGIIKGVWRAFKEIPQVILQESKSLIKNPIKTLKNCIMLLEKLPALSVILQEISSYLDSIEGNEEAKGEEIGHFIAEQVIHLLLPSKTKVISSLAKVTKLNELGGKAAGIIAGFSKQPLNGVKLTNKGLKKIGSLLEYKDKSAREVLKIRKGNASAFNVGRSDYWDKPLGEIANLAAGMDKEADSIMKLVKKASKYAQKYEGK